jgi:hypothetical protein
MAAGLGQNRLGLPTRGPKTRAAGRAGPRGVATLVVLACLPGAGATGLPGQLQRRQARITVVVTESVARRATLHRPTLIPPLVAPTLQQGTGVVAVVAVVAKRVEAPVTRPEGATPAQVLHEEGCTGA